VPNTKEICGFCEALLKLEWPGRSVAVTPAPLPDLVMDAFPEIVETVELGGVLDVTVGALPGTLPWVCFRIFVKNEVAGKDWLGVGEVLLRAAHHNFAMWPGPKEATSGDQSGPPQS
jgi:hypothetical protein